MVDEITGRIYAGKGDGLQRISEICSHRKQEEILSPAQPVAAVPMTVMGTTSTSSTVTPVPIAESAQGGVSHSESRAGRTAVIPGRARPLPVTSYTLPDEDQRIGIVRPVSSLQSEHQGEEDRCFPEIEFDWDDDVTPRWAEA